MHKSLILTIFRLLTPQDLGQLTETLKSRKASHKLAAGAELLVWDDDEREAPRQEGRVLSFPSKEPTAAGPVSLEQIGVVSAQEQKARLKAAEAEAEKDKPSESDFLIEEREKFKESEEKIFKQSGFACYQRSSDLSLYRVTVTDDKGKEKTRLTSTQGVLVNKKQA